MVLRENYMQKPQGNPLFSGKDNISRGEHLQHLPPALPDDLWIDWWLGLFTDIPLTYIYTLYWYIRTPWTENPFLSKQYNYERWRLFTWLMYNMMGFYGSLWVSSRFSHFFFPPSHWLCHWASFFAQRRGKVLLHLLYHRGASDSGTQRHAGLDSQGEGRIGKMWPGCGMYYIHNIS